mmetsp:Transcript_15399/g.32319  ORF Transcript_15399/g.32319 Transcript_15399/m.32319 type:complete len:80 (+) Transcript_15399:540-779(+)
MTTLRNFDVGGGRCAWEGVPGCCCRVLRKMNNICTIPDNEQQAILKTTMTMAMAMPPGMAAGWTDLMRATKARCHSMVR